jgi:hypothetical protein
MFALEGTITYSFVMANGEKLKFEINNRTGVIRTTHMLDRDEPAREKEVYLTVLATDNGRPQLDDVCTFKVTVEDINDNAPVFDKVVSHKLPFFFLSQYRISRSSPSFVNCLPSFFSF